MTDKLPPLPERAGWAPVLGNQDIFTADQLRSYAEEAVRLERERAAELCEQRAMNSVPDDSAIDELYFAAAAIRARSEQGR